jgi:hypothetical protein
MVLGTEVALFSGTEKTLDGFFIVLSDPMAIGVHGAQIVLS